MKTFIIIGVLILLSAFCLNAQWVQVSNGMGNKVVRSFAVNGNDILSGTNQFGIYITTNSGMNWTQTSLNSPTVYSIVISGNHIFAGTTYGVYLSTNNGVNWTLTGLNRIVISLSVNQNIVFAGTSQSGIFKSTNYGTNWTYAGLDSLPVITISLNGSNVFAGTGGLYGVYKSTNNGANWIQTPLNNRSIYSSAINGNIVYAGSSGDGLYRSTNSGTNWTQLFTGGFISALILNWNNIYSGSHQYGVYMSANNGTNWMFWNDGFPANTYVYALCILDGYIYAGTSVNTTGSGVYKRQLIEPTSINRIFSEIPKAFALEQNYPNPFNPVTKIRFDIPSVGQRNAFDLRLVIYDVLGREIAALVNEQLQSGIYEVTWDAAKSPSGVYYYTLSAGEFSETRKAVLVK